MMHSVTDGLNDQQLRAVTALDGPVLIIAGAGSGKTRVITHRIAGLLSRGVAQKRILALTFTNKAAREMRHRIEQMTGAPLRDLTISTFHAFGVQVLRSTIHLLGYTEKFSIYDQGDQAALLKEVVRQSPLSSQKIDLYMLSNLFSAIKTDRSSWDGDTREYEPLYAEYQDHLHAFNAVDFDDLIILPRKIFEKHPEALETYQDRYQYILVDEFQDTSLAQYAIVKLLAVEHRNLCVVGDDDQSIYSWRGASYRNIVLFEEDFPELIEIKLEQNYRSTSEILSAANSVIAHNTNRKHKELWTGIDGDRSIELHLPEDEFAEARFVAQTIRSVSMKTGLGYGGFGVLVRTNGLMATLEDAFMDENLPYSISGGSSFFARKEIKDLIAYLRVAANPDDEINFLRIINTPRRGIGKTTVQKIRALAAERSMSLYSAADVLAHAEDSPLTDAIRSSLAEFGELIERYRESFLSSRDMAGTLKRLVDELNLWGYLILEHQDRDSVAKYKYRNILRFIEIFEAWEKNPDTINPSLYDYLVRITLITRDENDDDEPSEKVNLMTIHAAKGLEFEVVILAGCENGIIPHARAIEEDEANVEEERRLFYVAITRARKKLYLLACRRRKVMREIRECVPSPFLEEIPDHLIHSHEDDVPVEEEEVESFFAQMKARLKQ